jgi:hypothetical protein
MTLKQIAQKIEDEEWVFLDDNGVLEKDYIVDRFELTGDQWDNLLVMLYYENNYPSFYPV